VDDTFAPRFDVSQQGHGGTRVLKAQSECPFRAFAEVRLNARAQDDASFGFDALDRGKFLHRALERVWAALQTQHHLREMTAGELQELIASAVNEVVECHDRDSELNRQLSFVERERLCDLILKWLRGVELERLQPFSVEFVEQERTTTIEGLQLKLRIDRIDRLDNGKLVLVDYKSGLCDASKLEGDRPSEPQILIYASTLGEQVDGLFFGQLKANELDLVGFSREQQLKSKNAKTLGLAWESRVSEWRNTVVAIAREFVSGYALVTPSKDACAFCQLASLCRKNQQAAEVFGK
jgi:ATP-dependent helicase/nuclease subunit B